MKYSPVCLAIIVGLMPYSSNANGVSGNNTAVEVIEVKGSYFNNYKVDEAHGAMRTNISLLETSQSVTVIPNSVITEQLATTLGEVLTNDASLTAGSKQRNREVFNLRGFELSSSNGYLRDGHQHWSHYQQPIEILENIEVIKGPSSILYGQSGPGGLVNMVTKKPTAKTLFNLGIDVDQEGATRFSLDAGGSLTDDKSLRYRGVLVKQEAKYQRNYQNNEQRQRDRFLGALVIDYDISDNAMVRVHYDRTDDEAGLDTGAWLDEKGNIIGNEKTIRDMSWAFTDITVENIGVDFNYALSDQWQVNLGYNEQNFERQRFESSPKKPSIFTEVDTYTSKPYDRFDDWQFKTAFIDFTSEFTLSDVKHQLLIGANSLDYYYGQLKVNGESINYSANQVEPARPDISYKTDDSLYSSAYDYYGVYIQDLITLNDQWQVSVGGRYDKQSKKNANNESLLPKAGFLFHPDEKTTFYASYSEGFEPQRSEKLENDRDINNGMKLDAMTSKQMEIGAKWQLFNERLLLTAALFDITKTGKLITEAINDNRNFDTRTEQAGEQRHKGFEVAAQGAVNDKIFVMASVMKLDAQYDKDENYQGKTPVDAPQWSASIWSRYEFNDQLAVNIGAFYEGERFADSNNTITKDAYTRIDVGATYKTVISNKAVNFRLNIQNLLDTDYLGGGGVSNVTAGDGTSFRLATQISF
ncbi:MULTISPECIES: TonB-dependent siderophore receptor [unclassified Colwellia]|uniref:TonB-dependent siderophore receptor n=1 Tax=unclassified Colwellia TaxID=196834 RepID=UPI0015F51592|nr:MULTISPECIES: TonB-dependent receptor [unclassified Colwellia]MBA6231187.1 TonB-dependent receptor [Colwellia sp. MB02u-7]MBA6235044.1 TonB-dependent receptor [Colwellia sp. MB02u-11]MBA6257572.1 TonB-dependent receptor [Colwellia sp. MB3u-28]MBA6260644.1 TonB-dependent receptor [Colwellia sp. MB3u-41]MBA6301747.1 TonB-dependent receptor [Colwellia sp. MB3u-22]